MFLIPNQKGSEEERIGVERKRGEVLDLNGPRAIIYDRYPVFITSGWRWTTGGVVEGVELAYRTGGGVLVTPIQVADRLTERSLQEMHG
jgi:hypothetical protein